MDDDRVTPRRLVERFYHAVWNRADEAVARDILAADFAFRASLGPERRGLFRGLHRGPLFGVAATGREISWSGAAFFTVQEGRIAALWVLGDIAAVKQQRGAGVGVSFGV